MGVRACIAGSIYSKLGCTAFVLWLPCQAAPTRGVEVSMGSFDFRSCLGRRGPGAEHRGGSESTGMYRSAICYINRPLLRVAGRSPGQRKLGNRCQARRGLLCGVGADATSVRGLARGSFRLSRLVSGWSGARSPSSRGMEGWCLHAKLVDTRDAVLVWPCAEAGFSSTVARAGMLAAVVSRMSGVFVSSVGLPAHVLLVAVEFKFVRPSPISLGVRHTPIRRSPPQNICA